jgi:hypothetical protein
MMNAHFAAAVPDLRIMESDIDWIPWDHELFDSVSHFEGGHLILPTSSPTETPFAHGRRRSARGSWTEERGRKSEDRQEAACHAPDIP